MKTQYAAINDLESVAAEIMKMGNGRLAIIFDPKLGWCVTDEIEVAGNDEGAQVVTIKAKTYADWHRPHIANAMNAFGGVRFLGQSAMDKLFRKAPPVKPPAAAVPDAAPEAGKKQLASVGSISSAPKADVFGITLKAPTKTAGVQAAPGSGGGNSKSKRK